MAVVAAATGIAVANYLAAAAAEGMAATVAVAVVSCLVAMATKEAAVAANYWVATVGIEVVNCFVATVLLLRLLLSGLGSSPVGWLVVVTRAMVFHAMDLGLIVMVARIMLAIHHRIDQLTNSVAIDSERVHARTADCVPSLCP